VVVVVVSAPGAFVGASVAPRPRLLAQRGRNIGQVVDV